MEAQQILSTMHADPEFKRKMVEDPEGTLQEIAMPLQTDVWIYRVVVIALALVALTAIASGVMLAMYDKSTPEGVIALGSTALGAIAGLLAPSPSRR